MSDPLLLTPGPLTTSPAVRAAMTHDWGSRDGPFVAMNARVRQRLVEILGEGLVPDGAPHRFTCIPVQGSGTSAVEAMLGSFVGPRDKLLILANGAYGQRIASICRRHGRDHSVLTWPEDEPVDPGAVALALAEDADITLVAAVHVETTTGILNPLHDIAEVVASAGRRLLLDAMSSFGALAIDVPASTLLAVAASSNKCLQGVPGLGLVIAQVDALARTAGQSPSLTLDLLEQWRALEADGQYRFTPPTQVVAALDQALAEHRDEGSVAGRSARYAANHETLVTGMRELGFETYLPSELQAPIIVTFLIPDDPSFAFERFHDDLRDLGFVIYPGKLTTVDTFRVGCIGDVDAGDLSRFLAAVSTTLAAVPI